ncbi:MAG: MBL fold metallo-hydrolase [Deltaproteobacteria bacterium]|jgi:alkyl sulfatase BDS1-like metallo-beta-lactamase superfamily hydrolase|nr:MBL fold metallo-hydrolase [Deltaproteobacteria bacterium]
MKKEFAIASTYVAVALCIVFLWISIASAFDPEVVEANPKLVNLSADWKPPTVYNVTDGVYVAVGYARTNPVLIEGTDGLIVIDPAGSETAAEIVKAAYNEHLDNIFSKKPVKAIIYTHYHDCHINGATVFAGNDSPEIISHESLPEKLFSPSCAIYSPAFPIKVYRSIKMFGMPYQDDPGYYVNGGIVPFILDGPSGYLPPTITVQDELETTIAGVNIMLIHAPGETSDIIFVWLPEKKVLVEIGNFYKSFPAIITLRGASFRNPLDYIESIDKMRGLNAEYLVMIHSGKPLVGAENISRTLTNYRDGVQFVHDQTVQNMNKGLTPGEIIEVVKLPPHLANDPYLQEYYGQIDRDICQIFLQYMGWYTGKSRDLFPMSPTDEAQEMAELAGGVNKLAAKAQDALDEGKLEWALILADDVLLLNPEHAGARTIKNAAMISLAEETYNAQTRNYLLSEYLEETGQITIPTPTFSMMDENLVVYMPMDTLFGIMAVSLNSSKSLDKDIVVGLHLTDLTSTTEPVDYNMHVRRGILEVQPQIPGNPEFTVTAESLVWKNVVLGKLVPQEAVSGGDIVIADADPQEFYNFLALFNLCYAKPIEEIPVYVDIKPCFCPNPLNPKSQGVLPVAVLGTEDFDVTTIDPGTIQLTREGIEEGVAPIRWSYEDVATPFEGELCDCHDLGGDGFTDLTLEFDTQGLVSNLKLDEVAGETIALTLIGSLKEEEGGTPIEGEDCIWVLK